MAVSWASQESFSACHAAPARARVTELNPTFEVLKVIASLAVVIIHTAMYRSGNVDYSLSWWVATFFDASSRFGTAFFVMIAGAIALSGQSNEQPLDYYVRKLKRYLPLIVFWSVFYLSWRAYMQGEMALGQILDDLLIGMPSFHLWFLFMMLGLHFFIPILRMLIDSPQWKNAAAYITVGAVVFTWAMASAQSYKYQMPSSFLELAVSNLMYCLVGYVIWTHKDQWRISSKNLCLACLSCVTLIVLALAISFETMGVTALFLFLSDRFPLASILSISLFLLSVRAHWPQALMRKVAPLGQLTLGVYIIHPFVTSIVMMNTDLDYASGYNWMLLCPVVYLLSLAMTYAIRRTAFINIVVR
ncbi:acyltransferase [Lampropedia puyangensis]|uniref:Acyltransferase n=1 Tax=Lampropedia puyangensis TaxID=1330072 RepID=A0A4S8F009_9BURK|nr:acyltransferase [Lampropedia puyangensis]THT98421.1 acyltransferase [Lampropedia puyangensis]